LYKNKAAIWYNKTCRTKQITTTYANMSVLSSGVLYSLLQRVTIPDAVIIQFVLLKHVEDCNVTYILFSSFHTVVLMITIS
jgi:aspartate oxidase